MAIQLDSGIADAFFGDLKSPSPVKKSWEKVYNQMIVHTRGASPGDLLKKHRPNEPEDIYEYRLDIYEPVTQDGINRGIDSLYRIISESNYHISYSPNIADYLKETLFTPDSYNSTSESMSFMDLMFKYVVRLIIDDPNGALVWFPVNPIDPMLPPSEVSETVATNLKPIIVNSSRIVHSSKRAFAWEANNVWLFEKSPEKYEELPFFYLTTLADIFRIVPTREATSDDPPERVIKGYYYEAEQYYNLRDNSGKERDMLPRVIFGGNSSLNEDGYWYYQSYFSGYVAWGNEAIRAFSDNQAVRVRGNFPVPEEKGQKCSDCKGAGKINNPTNPTIKDTCNKCGGMGFVPSRSPYSTYISEPPTGGDSEAYALKPAIQWHNPSVDILRESFTTWEKFIDKAEKSINIRFIEEAQSGVAKEVDRDKLYDMLLKFSNNLFNNIIAGSLNIILAYRVPAASTRKPSIVNAPNSFDIKSQKDLMDEIKELSNSGAPTPFLANTAKQLAGRVFHGDKITIRIIEAQAEYDPFFAKTYSELISFESANQLNPDDIPRHNYAYQIIREIADEKGDAFLTMKYSDIKKLADDKLKLLIPVAPVSTSFNLNGERIIEEANRA